MFWWHVEVAVLLGLLLHADQIALLGSVLCDVLLSTLEDQSLLGITSLHKRKITELENCRWQTKPKLAYLAELDGRLNSGGLLCLPPLALLEDGLGHRGQFARRFCGGGGWLSLSVVGWKMVILAKGNTYLGFTSP